MKQLIVIQWVQHTKNTQRIHKEYTKNTQRIHRYNPTNITNELIVFLTTRMRPLNASEELLGQICNLGALQRLPEESLMTLFAVILSSARGDNDKIWAFQYRVCRWICRSMSFHFMLVKWCPFYGTFMKNGWAMPHPWSNFWRHGILAWSAQRPLAPAALINIKQKACRRQRDDSSNRPYRPPS